MDPKLTMFVLLIGAIIGLSQLSKKSVARMTQQLVRRRWHKIASRRRKSSQMRLLPRQSSANYIPRNG